jgi:hypothetical protein
VRIEGQFLTFHSGLLVVTATARSHAHINIKFPAVNALFLFYGLHVTKCKV